MNTRLSPTTGEDLANRAMEPTGGYDPLSPVPKVPLPQHGSVWGGSAAREFLVSLSDVFSPPMPPGQGSGPSDPWFDFLLEYAQVGSEVRACYATWDKLLHVESVDRKAEPTDLSDMVRTLIRAHREIVDILQQDIRHT